MFRGVLLLAALAVPAHADEGHTSAEVATAPHPGDESGRIDEPTGDSALRVAARGVLFVPRMALILVTSPVHGLVWAEDRYSASDRAAHRSTNVRISPIASYETGFGASIGARVVDPDLFGTRAAIQAAIGLGYRVRARAGVDSDDRIAGVRLGLETGYERIPDLPYYGIGNAATGKAEYELQETRVGVLADIALVHDLHLVASTTYAHVTTGLADEMPAIDQAFPGLVGFGAPHDRIDPELELRWDDRAPATPYMPAGVHSAGSLARGFGGRVVELQGRDFWHYGAELQHYWRIGGAPRVLGIRIYGEGVTGSFADLPYYELPALGGDVYLRGYSFDRFRDRLAAFTEVQYRWDLSSYADAYLFVDTGRVYHAYDALSLDDLRVGFGAGVSLLSGGGHFLADGMIGSSIDGGVVLGLSFTPVEDRARRLR
ncbi:MAG: hypothetical protein ABI678_12930 [Kofleriaceae bacterium]